MIGARTLISTLKVSTGLPITRATGRLSSGRISSGISVSEMRTGSTWIEMLVSSAIQLLLDHNFPWKLEENNAEYTHVVIVCDEGHYLLPIYPKISYWDWHQNEDVKDQSRVDGTVLVHLMTTKAKGTL